MATNKTTQTENSIAEFINTIAPDRRDDSFRMIELFKKETGQDAKMWGHAIIGFGSYHYKYESGREGDAPLTGFSPRKDAFALYLSANFENREALLEKLGKHKTGKGCVYIKKLDDVDVAVLKQMIAASNAHVKQLYP